MTLHRVAARLERRLRRAQDAVGDLAQQPPDACANVVATLALATLGFERTEVELVADPAAAGNAHEIDALGVSGSISLRVESFASPTNPRTSMITAFSIARAVLDRRAALLI